MAPSADTILLAALLYSLSISVACASEGQEEIKVKPGEDVALECRGPRDADVTLLEWSRPELKADGYVFFYRNSRSYQNYQHPSFIGRVELRDRSSVKDGDLSVVLRNVTTGDSGTYECRVIVRSKGSSGGTTTETRSLISLKVSESGDTAENTWDGGNEDVEHKGVEHSVERSGRVAVGVSVAVVALVGFGLICAVIHRQRKSHSGSS